MVGSNAVKLILPLPYKHLHPVFNLSLISRYQAPVDVNRASDLPILTSLANYFINNGLVSRVLQFRRPPSGADEYLLCFGDASGLNDAWTALADVPPYVFPFLLDFHALFPYDGPLPLPVLVAPPA